MRRFDPKNVPRPSQSFDFRNTRAFEFCDLEIGAGVGQFAIHHARSHPERAVIAIEKTVERFTKFAHRIAHHERLSNLFAIHAEAASLITHDIPMESIDQIFILYPNPYPKAKHHNLRWHNRAFMGFLLERLKSGGLITMATNVSDYHDQAVAMMPDTWHLTTLEDRKVSEGERPRTPFEKKYMLRSEDCWNMVFKKP